jgi:hypothetical protein
MMLEEERKNSLFETRKRQKEIQEKVFRKSLDLILIDKTFENFSINNSIPSISVF